MIITPDHDIYVEQLSGRNRDLASLHMVGPDGMLPAAVNPASVYGFGDACSRTR